jgi:hypothetical protein
MERENLNGEIEGCDDLFVFKGGKLILDANGNYLAEKKNIDDAEVGEFQMEVFSQT